MTDELEQADVDRIKEALFAGRKIEAIKIYRAATRSGLKEAKDFIEELEPRLRAETPERFTAPPQTVREAGLVGCVVMLIVLAVVLTGVAWWLAWLP